MHSRIQIIHEYIHTGISSTAPSCDPPIVLTDSPPSSAARKGITEIRRARRYIYVYVYEYIYEYICM
jgi:hypothetical protein